MTCTECALTQLMQPCEACDNFIRRPLPVVDNDWIREQITRRKGLETTHPYIAGATITGQEKQNG